ncbi:luciferase family protein [Streptomyces sp. NPDC002328]|uniref:luciferase domain-containing protein n=1 Tax=Streptomyces sp. NPDC002328 TaxID=3364642 RepID=UPI00369497F8
MTLAQRALERLEVWPDLSRGRASCGAGRALRSVHSEILHFHSDHDVDLHLTVPAIQRIHRDLRASTAVRVVPGSRWVTVHLDCDTDVDLLMSLVSVALKAHLTAPPDTGPSTASATAHCNLHRVTLVPRDDPDDR